MGLSRPQDFNIELAEKVLDHLKHHPGLHVQDDREYCVIGWAVQLSGGGLDESRSYYAVGKNRLGLSDKETEDLFFTMGLFAEHRARHKLARMVRQARKYWSHREHDLFGNDVDRRVLAQARREYQEQEWADA